MREPVNDRPAARVGKRVKDPVERRILLKHLVKYSAGPDGAGTDQPIAEGGTAMSHARVQNISISFDGFATGEAGRRRRLDGRGPSGRLLRRHDEQA